MADVKISQLPTAGAITGAEQLPVVQDGATKRAPFSQIAVAGLMSFDDSEAGLGATTVQEAIVALKALIGAGPVAPTLNALTLSDTSGNVGAAYTGTVTGKTTGSTLSLTGAGAAGLSIAGTTVSGTPTTEGAVNLVETLTGATNTPRTSPSVLTVGAALVTLNALTLSASTFATSAASGTVIGSIIGKTTGSTVSVTDGRVAVSGDQLLVGLTASTAGEFDVDLTETLAGATNSPRVSSAGLEATEAGITFMPTSPVPSEAAGLAQLWPAYTGPAIQAYRLDTAASLDIPNGLDGLADLSGMAAFSAGQAVNTTTTANRWYDQSYVLNGAAAGERDKIFSTSVRRPVFREANKIKGKPVVSFGLQESGQGGQGFFNRPALTYSSHAATEMVVFSVPGGPIDSYGYFATGTSTTASQALSLLYDGANAQLHAQGRVGFNGPPTGQLVVFSIVTDATGVRHYLNGTLMATGAAFALLDFVGGYEGRGAQTTATNGAVDMVGRFSWQSALTPEQVLEWSDAARTKWGIQQGWTKLLYLNGDSIMAGQNEGGYNLNLARQLMENWSGPLPKTPNFARSGDSIGVTTPGSQTGRILNDTTNNPVSLALAAQSFDSKVALLWAGTNDIEGGVSGADVMARIQYWIDYHMDPSRFDGNVAFISPVPRSWTSSNIGIVAKEANRQYVLDNLPALATSMGFTLIDAGNLAVLTGAPIGGGNPKPPNSAYYGPSTGVHLGPAGYAEVRALAQPVLEGMLA